MSRLPKADPNIRDVEEDMGLEEGLIEEGLPEEEPEEEIDALRDA